MLSKKKIAPDYPRIPHIQGSNKTWDDLTIDEFNSKNKIYVQEKIDGANCRISWDDGPILGNRDHVLRKGYPAKTPAKKQFVPAWNWLHDREGDLKEVFKKWGGPVTIYGEWMLAEHSLKYDLLPDLFIAYDVWSVDEEKFMSPRIAEELLKGTNFNWIAPIGMSDYSVYRSGHFEGMVFKEVDEKDEWIINFAKFVRNDFVRKEDWNDKPLEKNIIKRSA